MKKLWNWCFNVEPRYTIVEVEKPRPLRADEESEASVGTLSAHPGFLFLTAKMRLQRSLLETTLKKSRHASMEDVQMLQSGIFWLSWMEEQVNRDVHKASAPKPQPAFEVEEAAFRAAQEQIELIEG